MADNPDYDTEISTLLAQIEAVRDLAKDLPHDLSSPRPTAYGDDLMKVLAIIQRLTDIIDDWRL